MQPAVMQWLQDTLSPEDIGGRWVLEVGSYDVNGRAWDVIGPLEPALYVGTDIRPGPGVGVAIAAECLDELFAEQTFGTIVCVETLEHIEAWEAALRAMRNVLAIGGLLVLTTCTPGFPRHDHPSDHWRFPPTMLSAALVALGFAVETIHYEHPTFGVYVRATRTGLPVPVPMPVPVGDAS